MAPKLYQVVRGDLSPGQQAVQSSHALVEMFIHYPELIRSWYESSNTLALLSVASEKHLKELQLAAQLHKIPSVQFREPDRNNETTALCLGPEALRLVRKLPLALRL